MVKYDVIYDLKDGKPFKLNAQIQLSFKNYTHLIINLISDINEVKWTSVGIWIENNNWYSLNMYSVIIIITLYIHFVWQLINCFNLPTYLRDKCLKLILI